MNKSQCIILIIAVIVAGLCWHVFVKKPPQIVKVIHDTAVQKYVPTSMDTPKQNGPYPKWITSYLPDGMTDYKQADLNALYNIYFSFSDAMETFCARKVRLGNLGDGGWDVCDDVQYQPQKPCLIYSFGIAGDWSFDNAAESVYGCEIHSFDPSINVKEGKRTNMIHFHKIGLSNSDQTDNRKWKMRTLASIKKELGHENRTIDVVKMDIEGSEWSALPQMVEDYTLRQVKQLSVEFHIATSRNSIIHGIDTFLKLSNFGFKKYFAHKNIHTKTNLKAYKGSLTLCSEIGFLNVDFQPNRKKLL